MATFKSVKLSDEAYAQVVELREILFLRGANVLPAAFRPKKTSFDGIVLAALQQMRKRVRG